MFALLHTCRTLSKCEPPGDSRDIENESLDPFLCNCEKYLAISKIIGTKKIIQFLAVMWEISDVNTSISRNDFFLAFKVLYNFFSPHCVALSEPVIVIYLSILQGRVQNKVYVAVHV